MPFLTEELWHAVYDGDAPAKSIALTRYPQAGFKDNPALEAMTLLQELIMEIRALRKEIGVEEKATVPVQLRIDIGRAEAIRSNQVMIERLTRASSVTLVELIDPNIAKRSTATFDMGILYERKIDVSAKRERLMKEIAEKEKHVAGADQKLNNPGFTAKAPAQIVEGLRKQREESQSLLDKLRAELAALPPE